MRKRMFKKQAGLIFDLAAQCFGHQETREARQRKRSDFLSGLEGGGFTSSVFGEGNTSVLLGFWPGQMETFCLACAYDTRDVLADEMKQWRQSVRARFTRFGFTFETRFPKDLGRFRADMEQTFPPRPPLGIQP